MKTNDLQIKIEALVRAHLVQQRAAAVAAVERAFAAEERRPGTRRPSAARAASHKRRPDDAIAALADRLLAAVEASPGVGVAELARKVGVPATDLTSPMRRLKVEGRVRSVGRTQRARYFPLTT